MAHFCWPESQPASPGGWCPGSVCVVQVGSTGSEQELLKKKKRTHPVDNWGGHWHTISALSSQAPWKCASPTRHGGICSSIHSCTLDGLLVWQGQVLPQGTSPPMVMALETCALPREPGCHEVLHVSPPPARLPASLPHRAQITKLIPEPWSLCFSKQGSKQQVLWE